MLVIVDRTKPRLFVGHKTEPVKSVSVVKEPEISKVDELNQFAARIRAKRIVAAPKKVEPTKIESAVTPQIKTVSEVANEIKLKRMQRTEVKHIPPETTPLEFRCIRKNGDELIVTPTRHAISQFKWRYWIVSPKLKYTDDDLVIDAMKFVFNSGSRQATKDYQYRNRHRKDSVSAMVWGGANNINFIIDTTTRTIITCELIGPYRKYNKPIFESLVKSHKFDRSRLTV